MGIDKFFQIEYEGTSFEECSNIIDYGDLRNKKIAVDALNIIWSNIMAAGGKLLSNKEGKRTHHIYITINQIIRFLDNSICTHWIFDSGKVHPLKRETVEERKKVKPKDYLTKEEINDIKTLLKLSGISYSVVNCEAEFYGAVLSAKSLIYGIISYDSDVLAVGGRLLRPKKIDGKSKILDISSEDIIRHLHEAGLVDFELKDLRKIAAIMGCDFCDKTPGIGIKSVLKKINTTVLTERQIKTVNEVFGEEITGKNVIERVVTNLDEKGLTEWLESHNFGKTIIEKLISALKEYQLYICND